MARIQNVQTTGLRPLPAVFSLAYCLRSSEWTSSEITQAVITPQRSQDYAPQEVILEPIQPPDEHNKADFTVGNNEKWEGGSENRGS